MNEANTGPQSPNSTGPAQRARATVSVIVRLVLCMVIIGAGVMVMMALRAMKKPPAAAVIEETVLTVEMTAVEPEDVPVIISGFGEASALNTVDIAPEVAGNIVDIHPRLEVGEIIPKGELLFRIDPRNYTGASQQAAAQAEQVRATITRLRRQYAIDQDRLLTLARSRELAQGEFGRVKELFESDDVGTRSGVDATESALNQAKDAYDRLNQLVALYPIQIAEAEAGLASAEAMLSVAEANAARTEVYAPFTGRVKLARVELGQYVAPGAPVLSLADDSVIEISVPIDSRDARNWLRFSSTTADGNAWFGSLEPVDCTVVWTESGESRSWTGTLHRIEQFDQRTRTVSLAIRLDRSEVEAREDQLPLVEGMFCSVQIPGKVMKDVFRLPRWAVSFEGEAYVSKDMRLEKRQVEIVREQDGDVFVRGGIQAGDEVILTRLTNPLPRTRLEYANPPAAAEVDS